ncbi:MAG: ArsA family ATPase [Candidatus Methylomirabilales bacterium]
MSDERTSQGSFLSNEELQLIIFGGKGGCGKTTAAAATAVHLAQTRPRQRILVVSTDPAHSLGDSLDQPVGDEITPVAGFANLSAVEFNAEGLMGHFKEAFGERIKTLAYRGTFFDQGDVDDLFGLPLPGLDEVMAILEISRILRSSEFDLIINDTAPTGHTVRMMQMPGEMEEWIRVFNLMQRKYRFLKERYSGRRYRKDEADRFLDLIDNDVHRMRSLLRDPRRTEFVPVTMPEPMCIDETRRLVSTLKRDRMAVRHIVVNRVPPPSQCPLCQSRREAAADHLQTLRETFAAHHLIEVPLLPQEVRGVGSLRSYADCLLGLPVREQPPSESLPGPETDSRGPGPLGRIFKTLTKRIRLPGPEADSRGLGQLEELLERDLEFILIGGKGGVGKTSLAAATALLIARRDPEKRVLIFSTDPAHSLADCFGSPIGDEITRIDAPGRLDALEIDAEDLFRRFKEEFQGDLAEVLTMSFPRGKKVVFDTEVMEELAALYPPGLDEIIALRKIMKFREEGTYDVYIVDSSPTGHLVRFLELPELMEGWVKHLLRLIMKYRVAVGLAETAKGYLELSRSVRAIRELLTDPAKTEMVSVTIPEAMGVLETKRLLSSLGRLEVPCRHLVVNMVIPPTRCPFCAAKREEQRRYLDEIVQMSPPGRLLSQAPLFPRPIKGVEALQELSNALYGPVAAGVPLAKAPPAVPIRG